MASTMSAVSATSTTTLKTDVTSKVLPGDKSGLPLEIWQIIFSFLSVRDLCHVARVSKTWYELALSIDMTRWKELYLACQEWKHPFWPLNIRADPPSWKNAYRDQYLSTRFWIRGTRHTQTAGCMSLLKRNRERQTIEVGPGLEHQTLKSALAAANNYDKILVHPGIYDEQLEMPLKSPFEIVGVGELGSVILVVCLEQEALTGRLSNLVLRAPWFTNFVLKVRSGYLQVDNCIVEDGMMFVQNPGTCHVHFCTFRHATVILQHINSSIVRNCEFSQSDNANVIVEGYPKEEKGWSYHHLCQQTEAAFHQQQPLLHKNLLKITESTTSTLHSTFTGKSFTASTIKTFDTVSRGRAGSHFGEEIASVVKSLDVNSRSVNSASMNAYSLNSSSMQAQGADAGNVNGCDVQPCCVHNCGENNASTGVQNCGTNSAGTNVHVMNSTSVSKNNEDVKWGLMTGIKCVHCQEDTAQIRTAQQPCSHPAGHSGEACTANRMGSEMLAKREVANSFESRKTQENRREDGARFHQPQDTGDEWLEINDETKDWLLDRPVPKREEGRGGGETIHFDSIQGENAGDVQNNWVADVSAFPCNKKASISNQPRGQGCEECVRDSLTLSKCAKADNDGDTPTGQFGSVLGGSNEQDERDFTHFENSFLLEQTLASNIHRDYENADVMPNLSQGSSALGPQNLNVSQDCPTCSADQDTDRNLISSEEGGMHARGGRGDADVNPNSAEQRPQNSGQVYVLHHDQEAPVLQHHHLPHSYHYPPHHHHDNHHHHPHHHDNHNHHHYHHNHYHHEDHHHHNHQHQQLHQQLPVAVEAVRQVQEADRRSYHSSHHSSSSSDDDLSILDELESGGSSSRGSNHGNNSSSSSDDDSDVEGFYHADHMYDCSDGEESVIMLPHLRQKHLEASLSANAVSADVGSICSQTTRPITLSASQDEGVLSYVNKVRGCLIYQCRMIHSKGGVMVSLQGHALVSECDISNVSYGIRCIQNARVVVLKNRIHHCRTSGIFMRLAASGLITGNDVHSNNEAGIDIRKSADPIIQHNRIHHGKRSGIVVLGSGRGQIHNNDIFSNTEAGIYILYGGNPTVSENQIYDGRAAGVAVNEGGRGFIFDNTITSNQWGGVDIRRGSCPIVCRNTITNGLGDGIVIGDQGQGTIENNVISDNAGCGVWLMSASRPYIHGNQINNNGDAGVMMVNKTDIQHAGSHLLPAASDSSDTMARSFSAMDLVDGNFPTPRPKCSHTTVQHNNIYHNAGRGVAVELGDIIDIMFNAIYANQHDGVWVNQDAPVSLCSNSISSNRGCGIIIALASSMQVAGNGIYDNCDCGIHCHSNADIMENDVVGNHTGGIIIESKHISKVCGNRIQSTTGPAVSIGGMVAESIVTDNKIFNCGGGDIIDVSQRAVIRNNVIMQSNTTVDTNSIPSCRISRDNQFNKSCFLSDPPARPAIEPPPPPSTLPAYNISTVTKVMVPSGEACQEGSKLCQIL